MLNVRCVFTVGARGRIFCVRKSDGLEALAWTGCLPLSGCPIAARGSLIISRSKVCSPQLVSGTRLQLGLCQSSQKGGFTARLQRTTVVPGAILLVVPRPGVPLVFPLWPAAAGSVGGVPAPLDKSFEQNRFLSKKCFLTLSCGKLWIKVRGHQSLHLTFNRAPRGTVSQRERNRTMRLILATGIILAGLAAAQADTAKFYSGGDGYSGPFSGAGTVYDATKGLPTNCPGGGSGCAGGPDIISTPQSFTTSVPITASATVGGAVWNDLQPNFGGLGVGLCITRRPKLIRSRALILSTLHFASIVTLTGVATLFDVNHPPFGTGFPNNTNITGSNTFLLNGNPVTFGNANMALLALMGMDFTFQQIAGQPAFYVSGLTYNVSNVPIPGAVWLFASGIAGIGVLARRRRKNQSAIAA